MNVTTGSGAPGCGSVLGVNSGRVSGFVTTYTDITEQKLNADQLERQHQVLKTILDNFPGAISLFDGALRMAACNGQLKSLLDFPDSLIDRPVGESAGPTDRHTARPGRGQHERQAREAFLHPRAALGPPEAALWPAAVVIAVHPEFGPPAAGIIDPAA